MICTKFKEYLRHKTNVPREISLSLLNECVNEAFAYITQTNLPRLAVCFSCPKLTAHMDFLGCFVVFFPFLSLTTQSQDTLSSDSGRRVNFGLSCNRETFLSVPCLHYRYPE